MATLERGLGGMSDEGVASLVGWWREAGVDTIVGETAHDWLNPPALIAAAPLADPAAALPGSLTEFQAWLIGSPELPAAAGAPRVGPSGSPESGLMVLIDMPSADDVAAGRLLSGEAGAQFDRMMTAIGRGRDSLYLVALSPARTPTGRLNEADAAALADMARHHAGLVHPKALLLLGDVCAKALLGGSVNATRGRWHELGTPAGPIRTLATYRPDNVLAQRSFRKPAWEDLQQLQEGLAR